MTVDNERAALRSRMTQANPFGLTAAEIAAEVTAKAARFGVVLSDDAHARRVAAYRSGPIR